MVQSVKSLLSKKNVYGKYIYDENIYNDENVGVFLQIFENQVHQPVEQIFVNNSFKFLFLVQAFFKKNLYCIQVWRDTKTHAIFIISGCQFILFETNV